MSRWRRSTRLSHLSMFPPRRISRREVDINVLDSLLLCGSLDDVTGNVEVILDSPDDGLFRQGVLFISQRKDISSEPFALISCGFCLPR